ncbi:MAG: YbjQ family protein [Patescibacteria group bacterium]
MILTTGDQIPSKEITQILGIARGSTVRARNVGRDISAWLKSLVGGEVNEYTKLQAEAREQAMQRMIEDAEKLGADAIISIRMQSSMIMTTVSEMLAYGTAVKLSDK